MQVNLTVIFNLLITIDKTRQMEEGKGFEPSIRYERIHAFQACALNHSATPPKNYKLSNINQKMGEATKTNHLPQ